MKNLNLKSIIFITIVFLMLFLNIFYNLENYKTKRKLSNLATEIENLNKLNKSSLDSLKFKIDSTTRRVYKQDSLMKTIIMRIPTLIRPNGKLNLDELNKIKLDNIFLK